MLTGQLNRSPTEIEIAQKLNIPLAAYQQLLGELKWLEIGSLHAERSGDSDEEELDFIPGRPDNDPLSRYLNGEMRERLTTAINDLPERERLVLTLYYYEETTMKEIGLILGSWNPGSGKFAPPLCCTFEPGSVLREPSKSHEMRKRSRNVSARGEENGGLEVSFLLSFTEEVPAGKRKSRLTRSLQGRQAGIQFIWLSRGRLECIRTLVNREVLSGSRSARVMTAGWPLGPW